jgi:hypothetical protein
MTSAIYTENLNSGSTGWQVTNIATTQIQMYCDKVSYNPGDTVTFFVSTQVATTGYTLNIYRLGYYGGKGGRLVTTISGLTGVAQGYWDDGGQQLNNCPTAIIDGTTHNLEAGWAASTNWVIPGNAVTGAYFVMAVDANGKQTGCTFVVKSTSAADFAYIRPVNTDVAYNQWGGYSLYTNPTVGVKVSFNRPIYNGIGTGGLMKFEIPGIKWLESQGYSLNYLTSTDIHVNPSQLLGYKGVLYVGHDEYWSKAMRNGAEAAIAGGVGAAFLGANCCYWQCRLNADAGSNPNRSLSCYKVQTGLGNLANDPLYGVDNSQVTTLWRDTFLNRPENTMIGIQYRDFMTGNTPANNVAWVTDTNADQTYWTITNLAPNTSYGSDIVGYEFDGTFSGGPNNLKIIGTSPATGNGIGPSFSNTTTYKAPSGALVFASGSIGWVQALDSFRWLGGSPAPIPAIQQLMTNVLAAIKGPVFSGVQI